MAGDPGLLGERVATTLAREHGEDYWQKLIVINGSAWLGIAGEATHEKHDLYDGKLPSFEYQLSLFMARETLARSLARWTRFEIGAQCADRDYRGRGA